MFTKINLSDFLLQKNNNVSVEIKIYYYGVEVLRKMKYENKKSGGEKITILEWR